LKAKVVQLWLFIFLCAYLGFVFLGDNIWFFISNDVSPRFNLPLQLFLVFYKNLFRPKEEIRGLGGLWMVNNHLTNSK
jgi:hypothetical protein